MTLNAAGSAIDHSRRKLESEIATLKSAVADETAKSEILAGKLENRLGAMANEIQALRLQVERSARP